jgi:hypothetical protein
MYGIIHAYKKEEAKKKKKSIESATELHQANS